MLLVHGRLLFPVSVFCWMYVIPDYPHWLLSVLFRRNLYALCCTWVNVFCVNKWVRFTGCYWMMDYRHAYSVISTLNDIVSVSCFSSKEGLSVKWTFYYYYFFIPSVVKIPRVKRKKRKLKTKLSGKEPGQRSGSLLQENVSYLFIIRIVHGVQKSIKALKK